MGLRRNPEVRRSLLWHLGIGIAVCAGGFLLGLKTGIYVFCVWLAMTLLHIAVTYRRYRKIAGLAAEIDRILHGTETLLIADSEEGELSILRNEIRKMTVRLAEQSRRLNDEKRYLADSLADISHQLRTPLTSVRLLAALLAKPDLTPQRRGELLRELHTLLSRVDWLVETLLKLSRLDAGTVQLRQEEISLETLLHTACEPLQIPAELHDLTLHITASGNFTGDPAWTAEAIGNIVKNCMEHTPSGGTVSLTAAENPLYSEIVITDTGCGIDRDDLPHIFERFYKGKHAAAHSFGIGLALARTIVTQQNGTIKAENLPAQGAAFTLRFYHSTV